MPTNRNGGVQGLLQTLVINIVLGVGFYSLFVLLRKYHPRVYTPRLHCKGVEASPPRGYVAWIYDVLKVDDEDLRQRVTLDAYIFLQLYKRFIRLFFVFLLLAAVLLVPTRLQSEFKSTPLQKLSILNHDDGTNYLVVDFFLTYLFCIMAMYELLRVFQIYYRIRHEFFSRLAPAPYSVLVSNVPESCRSEEAIKEYFERISPNSVQLVRCVRRSPDLKKSVEEREETVVMLDRALRFAELTGRRPHHRVEPPVPCCAVCICDVPAPAWCITNCCGQRVDSITFYRKRLEELNQNISMLKREGYENTSTAFVTFNQLVTANIFARSQLSEDVDAWHTQPAPNVSNVEWNKVTEIPYANTFFLYSRVALSHSLMACVIVTWTFFSVFISSLTNLHSLAEHFSFLKSIEADSFWGSILQGVVPSFLLLVVTLYLPEIVRSLTEIQLYHSRRQRELTVYGKLFNFSFYHSFLVIVISNAIIEKMNDFISSPIHLPLILASSIPDAALFYAQYMLAKGLMLPFIKNIRTMSLMKNTCLPKPSRRVLKLMGKDPEAVISPDPDHSENFNSLTFSFMITIIYSICNPLVLLPALVLFSVNYTMYKYQFLYLYSTSIEYGAGHLPLVFHRCIFAILVLQVTVVGVFINKSHFYLPLGIIPLFLGTLIFWNYCIEVYHDHSRFLPLETSTVIDHERANRGAMNWANSYVHPHYKVPDAIREEDLPAAKLRRAVKTLRRAISVISQRRKSLIAEGKSSEEIRQHIFDKPEEKLDPVAEEKEQPRDLHIQMDEARNVARDDEQDINAPLLPSVHL